MTNPEPQTEIALCPTAHELTVLPEPLAPGQIENPESPASAPVPQPAPRRPARNGKIARLPYLERDMVNRMLRNNIPHAKIVGALDEHGIRVTQRNVSNWKTRGGYKDWCLEQDRAVETRLLQDNLTEHLRKHDATQLPEVGLQLAATELSQFLIQPENRRQLIADPEKYTRLLAVLCRLTAQIHTLQKYRDESVSTLGHDFIPARVKYEDERNVEITREVYSAAKLGERAQEPNIPHHNYLPRDL